MICCTLLFISFEFVCSNFVLTLWLCISWWDATNIAPTPTHTYRHGPKSRIYCHRWECYPGSNVTHRQNFGHIRFWLLTGSLHNFWAKYHRNIKLFHSFQSENRSLIFLYLGIYIHSHTNSHWGIFAWACAHVYSEWKCVFRKIENSKCAAGEKEDRKLGMAKK